MLLLMDIEIQGVLSTPSAKNHKEGRCSSTKSGILTCYNLYQNATLGVSEIECQKRFIIEFGFVLDYLVFSKRDLALYWIL